MTGLGDALKAAMEWIYEWWPIRIVREWEQGIRLSAGTIIGEVLTHTNGPVPKMRGLHFFWPRLGEVIVQECNWDVAETMLQTVVSADGIAYTFGFAVQYRVRDLRLFYRTIHDHDATVLEAVRASAGAVVPKLPSADVAALLAEKTLEATRASVYGWGLEVKSTLPTTLVAATTLRLILDSPVQQHQLQQ